MNEAFDPNKHVPVIADVPNEESALMTDRPDIPPPSAWARGAVVKHRKTKQTAVIHRVDHITRQLRLWYPDKAGTPGEFEGRTIWHTFDDWEPEITLSPDEVARQGALKLIEDELAGLDGEDLELILALVDKGADPRDQVTKIRALKKRFVTPKDEVMPAEPAKKGGR